MYLTSMRQALLNSLNFSQRPFTVIRVAIIIIFTVAFLHAHGEEVYRRFQRVKRSSTPLALWYSKPVNEIVADGYDQILKTTGRPFVMRWWAKDWIILPPKYLPDLRDAKPNHLNFFETISNAFYLYKSVGDLYSSDRMATVVKKGLSPKLPLLTPYMLKDVEYAFRTEIGDLEESTSFTAQQLFSRIAHKAVARAMIGNELAHDQNFMRICLDFIMSIFTTALVICDLPLGPFRDLFAVPLSFWHQIKLNRAEKILLPVVKSRILEWDNLQGKTGHLDCIQWTLDLSEDNDKEKDPSRITHELLHNLWAATSAPGGLVLDLIFQLLLEPEYLEPLREEVATTTNKYGWSEQTFSSLKLQDSFIREINRLYPTGSITATRTVIGSPFRFSDGLTLPVGTRFAFPVGAILHDEANFSKPLQFSGFRFAQMRIEEASEGEGASRWSASALSTTNLAFGYGTHACPGRFFAIRIVKMIFSKLILEYDIEWAGHVDKKPLPMWIEGQSIPNLTQKITLRKRLYKS